MLRGLRNHTVVVTLTNGEGIKGVVAGTFWGLRIAQPVIIEASGRTSDPLEGSYARVPRRSIVWIQEV
jgi:hypothetical protein